MSCRFTVCDEVIELSRAHDIRSQRQLPVRSTNHCLHRRVETDNDPPFLAVDLCRPGGVHELSFLSPNLRSHQTPSIWIEVLKYVERCATFIAALLNMTSVGFQRPHVAHLEANALK